MYKKHSSITFCRYTWFPRKHRRSWRWLCSPSFVISNCIKFWWEKSKKVRSIGFIDKSKMEYSKYFQKILIQVGLSLFISSATYSDFSYLKILKKDIFQEVKKTSSKICVFYIYWKYWNSNKFYLCNRW